MGLNDLALVTIEQAKAHLRITDGQLDSAAEDDLLLKMGHATDIVLNYIRQSERLDTLGGSPGSPDPYSGSSGSPLIDWNEETVPPRIQAAILMQLTILWRLRGEHEERTDANDLAPQVARYLKRDRDPALA